jgi:hypothetical protein
MDFPWQYASRSAELWTTLLSSEFLCKKGLVNHDMLKRSEL